MNITGKKVTLTAVERDDLPLLKKWSNEPEIQYMLGGWHFPISTSDIEQWFDKLSVGSLNQRFAIRTQDGQIIGTANIVEIDWKNKNGFHGMLLGSEQRGKGYAVDTIMAIMRYAFEELGLERLDTTIIEYNAPSLKLYIEKCGWKEEGRQRNWYFRKGRFWDRVIVGVTKSDYQTLVEQNNYWS